MVCRPVQPHLSKMSQSGPLLLSMRHSLAFKYYFFKFMHTNKLYKLLRKAAFLDFGAGVFSLFFLVFATAENGTWGLSTRNVLLLGNTSQWGGV